MTLIIGVAALVALIAIAMSSLKTVRPTHRGLIERFGKYKRFANPGLHVILPFGLEVLYRVNTTEMMVSSEKREIITADSLNAVVDSNVYFRVRPDEENVKKAVYGVNNYQIQIVALAKTTLRNIIGTMTLKEANSERNKINNALYQHLSKETVDWGIEIVRTELKEIQPPEEVQKTMNSVVIANNEKIAAMDFATATETKADGERRAAIKMADGIKQSTILKAEGEAEAIKLVNEAANKYFVDNAQTLRKLQAVETSMQNAAKIIVPAGGSLVNVLGDLAGLENRAPNSFQKPVHGAA
jgi:regulator of protease activity HflC (stomatin/prohibitin superfamily)